MGVCLGPSEMLPNVHLASLDRTMALSTVMFSGISLGLSLHAVKVLIIPGERSCVSLYIVVHVCVDWCVSCSRGNRCSHACDSSISPLYSSAAVIRYHPIALAVGRFCWLIACPEAFQTGGMSCAGGQARAVFISSFHCVAIPPPGFAGCA